MNILAGHLSSLFFCGSALLCMIPLAEKVKRAYFVDFLNRGPIEMILRRARFEPFAIPAFSRDPQKLWFRISQRLGRSFLKEEEKGLHGERNITNGEKWAHLHSVPGCDSNPALLFPVQ